MLKVYINNKPLIINNKNISHNSINSFYSKERVNGSEPKIIPESTTENINIIDELIARLITEEAKQYNDLYNLLDNDQYLTSTNLPLDVCTQDMDRDSNSYFIRTPVNNLMYELLEAGVTRQTQRNGKALLPIFNKALPKFISEEIVNFSNFIESKAKRLDYIISNSLNSYCRIFIQSKRKGISRRIGFYPISFYNVNVKDPIRILMNSYQDKYVYDEDGLITETLLKETEFYNIYSGENSNFKSLSDPMSFTYEDRRYEVSLLTKKDIYSLLIPDDKDTEYTMSISGNYKLIGLALVKSLNLKNNNNPLLPTENRQVYTYPDTDNVFRYSEDPTQKAERVITANELFVLLNYDSERTDIQDSINTGQVIMNCIIN